MTKKENLRKMTNVLFWISTFFVLGTSVTRNLTFLETVLITILVIIAIMNLIVPILIIILDKYYDRKIYKVYIRNYEYLKLLHQMRYKMYFSDDKQKIDEYSCAIQTTGKNLLALGESKRIELKLSKKKKVEIQRIMEKTKELLKNEHVSF